MEAKRVVVVLAVLLAGCTVFSGWSDLQDGKPVAQPASTPGDASATPPSDVPMGNPTTSDASVTPPPPPPPTPNKGTTCGQTRCASPQGCCAQVPAPNCTTAATCGAGWFQCAHQNECLDGSVCCFDPSTSSTTCAMDCTKGQLVCDVDDGTCKVGACLPNGTTPFFDILICNSN